MYSCSSIAEHNSMEEILKKTVVPLPTYEMREKSPPPPESNSLEFMLFYNSLEKEQRLEFLEKLSHDFGVDHRWASDLAAKLLDTQGRDVATILQVEDRLRYSLTPRYRQLLTHISKVQGGVKFLVDLRADLIEFASSKISDSPHMRVNTHHFIVLCIKCNCFWGHSKRKKVEFVFFIQCWGELPLKVMLQYCVIVLKKSN